MAAAGAAFTRVVVPVTQAPEIDGVHPTGVAKFGRVTLPPSPGGTTTTAVVSIDEYGVPMPSMLRKLGLMEKAPPGPNYRPEARGRSLGRGAAGGDAAAGWGGATIAIGAASLGIVLH